jgi:uncharacterized protein
MTDDSLPPERIDPVEPPAFAELQAQPPERYPFWGWGDLLVFGGLTLPCMLMAYAMVRSVLWLLRLHPALETWSVVATQLVLYGLLFGVLGAIFRMQYDRPLLPSLAWTPHGMAAHSLIAGGAAMAVGVMLLGAAIRIPQAPNRITELLKDPTSLIVLGLFGSLIAPVCEELLFRGFLQPLLAGTLGTAAGIVITAAVFGAMHFSEYGNSWRHVLLLGLTGIGFGWVRHSSGSTRASSLIHAAYNGFQFTMLLLARHAVQ